MSRIALQPYWTCMLFFWLLFYPLTASHFFPLENQPTTKILHVPVWQFEITYTARKDFIHIGSSLCTVLLCVPAAYSFFCMSLSKYVSDGEIACMLFPPLYFSANLLMSVQPFVLGQARAYALLLR